MKCSHCGFEHEMDFAYCPVCGNSAPAEPVVSINPAAHTVLAALKDSLFLVICILVSIFCIFSMAADNLPLIEILITVFLWLAFAKSRKDIADSKQLRNVSGAIYAQYVISYVVAGLLVLIGFIFAAAFGVLASDPGFIRSLFSEFMEIPGYYDQIAGIITAASGWIILVVFVIAAGFIVLINVFSMRYIHRFAKSVYTSIDAGCLKLKYVNAAKNWLIVFAVFAGISALSSLGAGEIDAGIASAASCAANILGSILIRRYFITEE